MGYKESSESRRYLEKLKKLGKDNSLVPYTYNPPLERIMDISSIVLIIAAMIIGIYFKQQTNSSINSPTISTTLTLTP